MTSAIFYEDESLFGQLIDSMEDRKPVGIDELVTGRPYAAYANARDIDVEESDLDQFQQILVGYETSDQPTLDENSLDFEYLIFKLPYDLEDVEVNHAIIHDADSEQPTGYEGAVQNYDGEHPAKEMELHEIRDLDVQMLRMHHDQTIPDHNQQVIRSKDQMKDIVEEERTVWDRIRNRVL